MITFVLFAYRGILTRATRLTGYKALNPLHLSAWICPRVQPNPNYYNSPVAYINLICKRLTWQPLISPLRFCDQCYGRLLSLPIFTNYTFIDVPHRLNHTTQPHQCQRYFIKILLSFPIPAGRIFQYFFKKYLQFYSIYCKGYIK